MAQKTLLMLGGTMQQIPAIRKAKEMGCKVVTCDYLPGNPGHKYADEYRNASTTDLRAVLEVARDVRADGIIAYASDPSAPTAAYVAEQLGLPGNPYESVRILARKDLFRELLLSHGFNCPKAASYDALEDAREDLVRFSLPVMVKPVDSSGSKGVVKVSDPAEFDGAAAEAMSYSRCGRIVVEEFIEKQGYQVSGDAFSVDGRLAFSSYGNELYSGDGTRDYVALGEFWPSELEPDQKGAVDAELQCIMTALGMGTGPYNVEVIIGQDGLPYVLELGPRSGGSYIPQLIEYATGVDLVEFAIRAALGQDCSELQMSPTIRCVSNYMIYSTEPGAFERLEFDPVFERDNLLEAYCTATPGDAVEAYRNTSHSLGTIIFQARDAEAMRALAESVRNLYRVVVR